MKREHLENLNVITAKMLETLFNQQFELVDHVKPEQTPTFKSKYLAQIGLRNKTAQVHLMLGFSEEASQVVLKEVLTLTNKPNEQVELAKSALGELSNTVACEVASNKMMIEELGQLLPTPPLVWVMETSQPDFIKGDGLSGYLQKGELKIHTFISILPVLKIGKGNVDANSWSPTESLSIYDPHSSN
ncbi:MAG: hypothetical protein AB8G05_14455 [Oligoflexales bacterium]